MRKRIIPWLRHRETSRVSSRRHSLLLSIILMFPSSLMAWEYEPDFSRGTAIEQEYQFISPKPKVYKTGDTVRLHLNYLVCDQIANNTLEFRFLGFGGFDRNLSRNISGKPRYSFGRKNRFFLKVSGYQDGAATSVTPLTKIRVLLIPRFGNLRLDSADREVATLDPITNEIIWPQGSFFEKFTAISSQKYSFLRYEWFARRSSENPFFVVDYPYDPSFAGAFALQTEICQR